MFNTKKIYLDAFRKGKQQCIKLIILKRTHMCNDMTHNVTMYKSDITVNRNGNELFQLQCLLLLQFNWIKIQ